MSSDASIVFALGAACCWAISAPIISQGLAKLRGSAHPIRGLLAGLALGLCVGAFTLLAVDGPPQMAALRDTDVILGGLLTYVSGTGLYYLAAVAYQQNAGVAAQFANVKPILTILASVYLFQETFDDAKVVSFALIVAGCAIILIAGARRGGNLVAPVLGILLALSWSGGEVFVRRALDEFTSFEITKSALII